MNNSYNGRYVMSPKETYKLQNVNNKYIHLGDIYITNLYNNNYYTTIVNLKVIDLFSRDLLDIDLAIDNNSKTYYILVNKSGNRIRTNNIFCVLTSNESKEEYKIEVYFLSTQNEYNLSLLHYEFSKWAEFKPDNNFTVVSSLPTAVSSFTKAISADKTFLLTGSETATFTIRKDINLMHLGGYTLMENQSTFKNVNMLYKNYVPSETVYFTAIIHDDTNDKYYLGYFKWEKDIGHVVMLDSTIPSDAGTITYKVYWNLTYFVNYLYWKAQ